MQLNSQLMPAMRRRVGMGASATVIQPGQAWSITVSNVGSSFAPSTIPQALVAGLSLLGPVVNGQQTVRGVYSGSTPFTIPSQFSYSVWNPNTGTTTVSYPVVSASVSGSPSCPSGMYWNGSACVAIPACPANYHWDSSLNRCVVNSVTVTWTPPPPAPPPAANSGSIVTSAGATKYGAGVFTFIPGHRIQSTATASGGAMPAAFSGVTIASLQAAVDPTQFKVVSVSYPSPLTMVVVYDYTGPNKTIGSPVTFAAGAVTMTTIYADQGPTPSAPASSSKTLYYVAGAGVLSVAAVAAYMKWGRK